VAIDLVALIRREVGERKEASSLREVPENTVTVRGDPVALHRLFANLFDNALRYGTAAEATVRRHGRDIEVLIDDNGPGIPELERAAVFEPFYRVDPSRSRETGGAGLGLAIARAIVEAHGGRISAESARQGGARIRVVLPSA
jgi:signal transduction histidine kinase